LASPLPEIACTALVVATLASACATGSNGLGGGEDGSGGVGGASVTSASGPGGAAQTSSTDTASSATGATTSASTTSTSATTTSTSASTTSAGSGGAPGCALGRVVISEVRSRGAAGAADEIIELYNATDAPVTLDATWKIEGRSDSGASYTARWKGTGGVVPPFGHYLIAGTTYAQLPAADAKLGSGITDAASLRLVSGNTVLDAVCYGYDAGTLAAFDATYTCEGAPASNTPHDDSGAGNVDVSFERKPGGASGNCTDTGDSASDFAPTSPATPPNSASAPTP
jgi:hypothetical protein